MKKVILAVSILLLFPATVRATDFTIYAGRMAPFTTKEDCGCCAGAVVDMVVLMMGMAGDPITAKDIRNINWARAVEDTETRPGTMIFCMARIPERENKFKWVGPVAHVNIGLIAKRLPRIVITSPEDIREYPVCATRNSAPLRLLQKQYDLALDDITLTRSIELQFKMLDEGRVKLIAQADTTAPYFIHKLGRKLSDFEMVSVMERLDLYIALNRNTDDGFVARLQAALDELKKPRDGKPSRYDEIMRKYLVDGPISVQRP